MNSLLSRVLAVGAVAILSFALITAAVVQIGFRTIVKRNDKANSELLARTIAERLSGLPGESEYKTDQRRLSETIDEIMLDLPAETEYLTVEDGSGRVLYQSRKGKAVPLPESRLEKKRTKKEEKKDPWFVTGKNGDGDYRFSFKTLRVDAAEPSVFVLKTLWGTALWGALAAAMLAGIVALIVSLPLSRQAKNVAAAISDMRNGRRDVKVPEGGVKEIRQIAASAADLQDTLRKEETIRAQWTADIAHDLRTPLTVLKGQFEGMLDGVFIADNSRLERNYREILSLERLVNQLADLNRLESPDYRIQVGEFDAGELLEVQGRRFADEAKARGIWISIEEPVGAGRIRADSALLERALANLIDNAVRYGDRESELRLSASRRDGGSIDFVVDNAGVIDPADRDRVFDRLYRGDRSRSTRGTGIGLAIVRAIAEAHRGTAVLRCDDAAQRTLFILSVPTDQG